MEVFWNGGTPSSHPCYFRIFHEMVTNQLLGMPRWMESPKSKIPKIAAPIFVQKGKKAVLHRRFSTALWRKRKKDDSRMWKTWISIGEVTTCHGFSAHCPTCSCGISPSLWVSSSVPWGLLKVAWGSMGPYRRIHPGYSLCFSLCQRKLLEHVRTCFCTTENWHETQKKIPLKSSFLFLSQSFLWGVNFLFQNDHHLLEMNQKLIFTDDSAINCFPPHLRRQWGRASTLDDEANAPLFFLLHHLQNQLVEGLAIGGSGGSEVKVDVVHLCSPVTCVFQVMEWAQKKNNRFYKIKKNHRKETLESHRLLDDFPIFRA